MIIKILGATLACTLVCALAWADQTSPVIGLHHKTPNLIAFTNATIHSSPGQVLKNATLVIENGQIKSVAANGKPPAGASQIDLRGYTVYPGFIDTYSEYGIKFDYPEAERNGPVYRIDRIGGNAANGAIHAQRKWSQHFAPSSEKAKEFLSKGFTSVQSAKLDGLLQGRAMTVSLADGIANDLIYKAQSQHFGSFDKGSSPQNYPSSLMGSIALLRQTFSDANWYQTAKGKINLQDGEKIEFNAALAALAEIEHQGLVFSTDNEQSLLRAAKLASQFDIDLTLVGSGFEYARLDEISQLDAKLIMPLAFADKPELGAAQGRDISLADLRHWERNPGNLAVLENTKLKFAITSHGIKSDKFLPNLRRAIRHGLSEEKALAALTTVAAEIAGIATKAGQIKPGFIADLVITKGNIFDDGKIVSVWTQGQKHQLINANHIAISGEYNLISHQNNKRLNLSFELGEKEPKVIVKHADKKLEVSNIEQDADTVSFVLNEDVNGVNQPIRYHLWQDPSSENLTGQQIDVNQQQRDIIATIATTTTEKVEDAQAAPEYLSQLSWPNRAFGQTSLPKSQRIHFKNATVWTSEDEGILEHSDVIIANGKFVKIGRKLETPSGYQVIDATGKHITAGIIDEHSHIAISRGVNEGTEAITAEVKIGDVINPDDIHIYRSLAGGTTTAQLLHGSANPIGGQAQIIQLKWGESAQNMKLTQAPGSIKFALGENVKQSNWGADYSSRYPQTRMGVEALLKDAFQHANEYQQSKQRWNELGHTAKQHTAPVRTDYRLDTLVEVLASQRHIHVHSYVQSEILMFMRLAESFGFKVATFTHILEGYKLADEMSKHGAGGSTFADWWAYKFEVYDAIPQNACLMTQRGVLTSINSDSNDLQRRLNQEAAKSITYCDMSPTEAWKMITINPAKQLKIDHLVGSIKVGKQADFAIWDHDPLSVYARAEQTWINGRKYFDLASDRALRQSQRKEKASLLAKLISDKSQQPPSIALSASDKMAQPAWQCDDNHDTWQQHDHQLIKSLGGH